MNASISKEAKITKVTLGEFQGEQIIWLDYEDGTYRAIFVS